MTSFYPGPSKVYDQIPKYVKEAHKQGILSINHRSTTFEKLYKETISVLKEKLLIPEGYSIFFTSSATECWEIIAQSLMQGDSHHFFNGAFGEKWHEYSKKLHKNCIAHPFDREEALKIDKNALDESADMICITQNETSNGTMVSNKRIAKIRKQFPNHLIAVDATSSMAGVQLDFLTADVWYASVQKCFGLPAGMALMVCSPKSIKRAIDINERNHYNSLSFIIDKVKLNQTTYTPNVLSIYLLNQVMQNAKPIDSVEKKLKKRIKSYYKLFDIIEAIHPLITNKKVRSITVLPLEGKPEVIGTIKTQANQSGILLGNGYGKLKDTTFRIANFPAIKKDEISQLSTFFEEIIW